ncbi:hypothetical protein M3P05_19200 [Sansalvadorimonas sp. 2012CJ34-2]|uniref:Uncharacterized protein n=1 Tax=Parendozoicomonas callyspongiae TaxID=2942213 RepID=A0ABT0PNM1_9GAMM|nr:hypothetical protein [Sansalvadorimonas sp. 2012CJ34-2]MCL6272053.1 hypothetical protein [Sansalvadorimonas sp. 2012CJ34-2]
MFALSGIYSYARSLGSNCPKSVRPKQEAAPEITQETSDQSSRVKEIGYSVASALGKATWAGTKVGAWLGWEATKIGAKVGWEATKVGAKVGWEATKLAGRATSTVASAGVNYLIPDEYSSTDEFVDAIAPKGGFLSVEEFSACEDIESLLERAKTSTEVKANYPRELAKLLKKHGSEDLSKALEKTATETGQKLPSVETVEAYSGLIDIVEDFEANLSRGQKITIKPAVDKLRKKYGDQKMASILQRVRAEYAAKRSMTVEWALEHYKRELASEWSGNPRGL